MLPAATFWPADTRDAYGLGLRRVGGSGAAAAAADDEDVADPGRIERGLTERGLTDRGLVDRAAANAAARAAATAGAPAERPAVAEEVAAAEAEDEEGRTVRGLGALGNPAAVAVEGLLPVLAPRPSPPPPALAVPALPVDARVRRGLGARVLAEVNAELAPPAVT